MINRTKNYIFKCYQILIAICFSVMIVPTFTLAETEEPDLNESLSIVNSQLHHSKADKYNYISCIGKLKNVSNTTWEEPVFEIQFFNSNNELIDTFTEYIYGMVIPPNDEVAFRLKDSADKNIEEYQFHKVRITSAQPVIKYRSTQIKSNTLSRILISWFPMLLLIAVWIFFMRKYQGKNSPQKKIIAIQEKQYSLIEQQNLLFEKLIATINDK